MDDNFKKLSHIMLLLIFTFPIQTPTYYTFLESLSPVEDKIEPLHIIPFWNQYNWFTNEASCRDKNKASVASPSLYEITVLYIVHYIVSQKQNIKQAVNCQNFLTLTIRPSIWNK